VEPQKKDFKPVKGKVVRAKKLAAPKKKDNNTPDPWWQNDPTYNAAWTIYIRWMKQTK
jgi:hypothetical protein